MLALCGINCCVNSVYFFKFSICCDTPDSLQKPIIINILFFARDISIIKYYFLSKFLLGVFIMAFQTSTKSPFWSTKGRIGRLSYLFYLIFIFAFGAFAGIFAAIMTPGIKSQGGFLLSPIGLPSMVIVYYLLVVATIKRLHDCDFSGLWALLIFIPYVGQFVSIVLLFIPGTPGRNEYGSAPK